MQRHWLTYALITTLFWGAWGALTGLSAERGFPDTLVYVVWALTMIPPALIVLARAGWRLQRDRRAVAQGLTVGLLGAGGQMLLFRAVESGPAYLIFPIVSLSPAVTIALSFGLLGERTGRLGVAGIVLALCALPLFDFQFGQQGQALGLWFGLALIVMASWGLQAYFLKTANAAASAESIFFYMTVSALLCIPAALWMTDFSRPIPWGWDGPGLAAVIQVLNAIGALTLVHAFRHGKALVVSPLVNAGAPLLTALLSMALSGASPSGAKLVGVALALLAALLLALQPEGGGPVKAAATDPNLDPARDGKA
ncbi:EamA family transporter [Roseateles aquatilis]|uniref:EamA family transporter n=1 Tax=Roseateles aquatilis TaxID=431061 RepID=A0A246J4M9_9BURK|nr:DMT family transporter [Roseateles aquatilis]OWQ87548.1 EamA family transporter [Roseateles aquatilis]